MGVYQITPFYASRLQQRKTRNMLVNLWNHIKVQSFALLSTRLFFCPFFQIDKENKTAKATERCVHELHGTQRMWVQVRNPEHTLLQFKHTPWRNCIMLQRKTMGQLLQLSFVLGRRFSSSRFLDLLVSFTDLKKTRANWTCLTPRLSSLTFPAPLQFGTTHRLQWLIPEVQSGLCYQELNECYLGYHWACVNFMVYIFFSLYLCFCFDGLLMWKDPNCCSVSVHCSLTANTSPNMIQANI